MTTEPEQTLEVHPVNYRHVLGHFPTGVVAVTSIDPATGEPIGMTIGSFSSVSLDPPLVAFLPAKESYSFGRIREAGVFCVNVLSADQEQLCRSFATRGREKFEGTNWRPAPSGSPIFAEVVAWMDCEVEAIHEAGDHYIVVGRIRDMQIGDGDRPLLFFQGGYGSFTLPWLAAPARPDLVDLLRQVDLARGDMIELAEELNVECLASAEVDGDLVILASAGKPGRRLVRSVGQRVPLVPPVGIALVAWRSADDVERWITAVTAPARADDQTLRGKIDRVRRRGWAVALASREQLTLEAAVTELDPNSPTSEQEERLASAVGRMVAGEGYEPEHFENSSMYHVRHMSAPVFGPAGDVPFALNIYGMPRDLTGSEIRRYSDRLTRRAAAIARVIAA
jgi:flavin reductase (DIM6/NTAB) family NADH-FMN oxidoreductase RutF/DNA-binding IclR family transcriptional regulator